MCTIVPVQVFFANLASKDDKESKSSIRNACLSTGSDANKFISSLFLHSPTPTTIYTYAPLYYTCNRQWTILSCTLEAYKGVQIFVYLLFIFLGAVMGIIN